MSDSLTQRMELYSRAAAKPEAARPLDKDIVVRMKAIGFQPFIMVRVDRSPGEETEWITCKTQNEAGDFVTALAAVPEFAVSKLLRALERALRTEVYDAADLLFVWAREGSEARIETVLLGMPKESALSTYFSAYVGYPVFSIEPGTESMAPGGRAQLLIEMLAAYQDTPGNDALRFMIIESIAFALSRILGSRGEYGVAAKLVDQALQCRPYSIYLKAARHALRLKLEGKPVPERLMTFIGEDTGYLKRFVCPEPFKRFDIGPAGDVLVCCGHWLPTSIGNFIRSGADEVLNSVTAQAIRRSMTDGTYKYCNHLECGALIQGNIPTREELEDSIIKKAIELDDFRIDRVDQVLFAFDQTCNLSCPSCRQERIIEKVSASEEKARVVEEKLLPLLPKLRVLNINPAGELFASKPSRRILELINPETCPDLVLDIISNGTLFSEEEWNKFPGIHGKIRSVRISVDAARKETFEALRRLGKYDTFVRNMRFLGRLRAEGVIPQLKFSFTYQLQNFGEMPAFVEFCESMNCDFVIFERLQNLGAFSDEEFRQKAVHLSKHPLHQEFLDVVRKPIFHNPRVWHDFDYEGVELLSREEARRRLVEALRVSGKEQPENAKEKASSLP